jgi:signal transduction histidine kinase
MPEVAPPTPSYAAYWQVEGRQRATEQLRPTVFFVLVCQVVFTGLDRWAYPDTFPFFFSMRMAVNALLVWILLRGRFTRPNTCQTAIGTAVAAEILAMVYTTGGPTSLYYPGLMLVFMGMPVLMPVSVRTALAVTVTFWTGYAVSPLFVAAPIGAVDFGIALIFLAAAALEGVVSAAILMRARLLDFAQRSAIERARVELEALDREKSRFTANIHHELRTPLTLMLAPVEGMLGGEFGELSEVQTQYLRTVQSNGLRLLKLINNLLDLAKIEGQKLAIRRVRLRPGSIVRELVESARALAERKGVTLSVAGFDAVPEVCIDREAFEKIVVNLLGNALKFTEAGGRIEVRAESDGEPGLHLVVADTGIGIPPDQLGRIFDRFAQVDGSNTRKYEGTGIGLSLVQELVKLHGGSVWATSEGLGHGSQLHVSFPIGEPDGDEEETLLAAESSAQAQRSLAAMEADLGFESRDPDKQRLVELERSVERAEGRAGATDDAPASGAPADAPEVLVTDDNPDLRRLLAFLLGREFRVRIARNGREALEAVRERAPDLVLTDVMMPEMSGTELCAALKGDPATRAIPLVLLTSKAERQMKIEGLELGADDYVAKPFHPRELLARVRSLVRLRRLQAELARQNEELGRSNAELERAFGELRAAEAQLVQAERLKAVGELAAGVAHEVNNPVNFALNALHALRSHVDEVASLGAKLAERLRPEAQPNLDELREILGRAELATLVSELVELGEIVAEGLQRTSRLVGDLRDFAKPGDGASAQVDLAAGLRSTVQLVRRSFEAAGVALRVEVPSELASVRGDARALNQLVLNLLKNAVEAVPRGGNVELRARSAGARVEVEVRDDGPGIPEEVLANLFRPFFTTKRAGQGSGLGLSISRRIAEQHGGSLDATSEPGRGACFRLVLPSAESGTAPEPPQA